VDPDGIIRRNLLYQPGDLHPATAQAKEAPILPSFSLQLALRYLRDEDIEPEANRYNPEHLQLRNTVFVPLQQNDGGYIKADTRGYQVLLNYRGGPQTIPFVSLGAVLRGEVPEAQIRDRIILIGNVAESAKDFFYTPYSAGQAEGRMPGVMVHAQMVSQFLDAALDQRRLLWVWPEGIEALWILGWALLGAGLAVRSPRLFVLLVTAPASVMVLGGLCFWVMVQGGWIPLVPPLLSFVSATVGAVAYRAQQSQRQQQMVMRLLGQSTSPEIAATLWQQRDALLRNGQLPGQRLTATIVFTDLKGFSTISERYPPEQLLLWLNEYLDEMARQVQQYQGVINKFTGDGIMAVFGVPIAHERPDEIRQDAQNAVDCAIAMGERLDRLNQSWQAQGLPAVQMRVGIFTGPVVVGSLGSPIRLEYGVIGDGVNIASRLESVDKNRQPSACRILIAQQTQACLPSHYQVESWGMLSLAGKQVQVEVFLVTGCNKSFSSPA
ncbi:MAG TPA: adenylate/guanylate cyclase domain-containing protein, partial [Stenomitos sp.]